MLMHAILRLQRVKRESFGECNPIEEVIEYRLSKLTPEIAAALGRAPSFEDFEAQ